MHTSNKGYIEDIYKIKGKDDLNLFVELGNFFSFPFDKLHFHYPKLVIVF